MNEQEMFDGRCFLFYSLDGYRYEAMYSDMYGWVVFELQNNGRFVMGRSGIFR